MYERLTDRARKVVQLANQEAMRFNHEYIGTEHILLGLVKEGSGVAANVLKNLDVNLPKVRDEVEKIVQSGSRPGTAAHLPQTPRAKKVIEYAIEEARALNHNYVGTEHLLLGLIREVEGVASQVLMNLGLTLAAIRAEVLNLIGQGKDSPAPSAPEPERIELPPRIAEIAGHLEGLIELCNQMKEEAIAATDFEWAADLRDQADKLAKDAQVVHQPTSTRERARARAADFMSPCLVRRTRKRRPIAYNSKHTRSGEEALMLTNLVIRKGTIRGGAIVLETGTGLPENQPVLVGIGVADAASEGVESPKEELLRELEAEEALRTIHRMRHTGRSTREL